MQLSRSSLQKLNFVLALCLIVLCRSGVAEATTFFVSTMGSDTNPGTQLMPFRTIKKGTSVLKSGDTLLVEGGTYEECIFNSIPGSSSWTTPG